MTDRALPVRLHRRALGVLTDGPDGRPVMRWDDASGLRLNSEVLSRHLRFGVTDSDAAVSFFGGLLPEGVHLDRLARHAKTTTTDIFGMLAEVGADLAGALRVGPERIAGDPVALSSAEVRELLREAPGFLVGGGGSALPGFQRKLTLTRSDTGGWVRGNGQIASTHILKPVTADIRSAVESEAYALAVTREVGLTTFDSWVEELDDVAVLVVERYDRRRTPSGAEDGLIARNPARGVRLPKEAPKSHPYLTFGELQELVDTIDQRFRTLIVLLSFTGLRIGEASGLKRKHVDFERRRLLVIDANSVTKGKVHEGTTKNNRIRSVPFSEMLEPLLRSALKGKGQDGLVFTMAEGGPIRHDLWRKRYFRPAIEKINAARRAEAEATGQTFQSFPKITPHDLRHTTASVAAKSGASVKSIQKILGHSSAKITIDTYIDLFESDVDDVIDSVAELAANANFRA